jgi:pimeloyl-ACP methyl ester carboxylesterase
VPDLNYDRRGDGPPLLLIHGIGSRWQVWEPILDDVAEHYDVISVDLPGFGVSPVEPSLRPGVPGFVTRLADLCDELGLDRPTVAGNSMGGAIALELGRQGIAGRVVAYSPIGFWNRAERIWCQRSLATSRRLAGLVRPALPRLVGNPAGRVALAGQLIGHPDRVDPAALLEDVHALIDAPGFGSALEEFAHYTVTDPAQEFGALRDIPATVAWGSRDALLIYATQHRRAAAALPWAEHVTLPSSGHVPFYDDPRACADLLIKP